jgi:carboxyl-terminal processing protease
MWSKFACRGTAGHPVRRAILDAPAPWYEIQCMISLRTACTRGLLLLAAVASVAACGGRTPAASSASPPASAPIDPALALQTFDSAWSRVNTTYYDSTFRGIDWGAVHRELRPRAGSARTTSELRSVMNEMLGRLGESHFTIIPREQVDPLEGASSGSRRADGEAGLAVRWVDGELTVTSVESGGGGEAAGIRTGWIIDAIGDREIDRWKAAIAKADNDVARRGLTVSSVIAALNLLNGDEGTTVTIRARDAADAPALRELTRRSMRGEPVQFGNLPTMHAHLEHQPVPLAGGGCAGLIRFNVWMVPLSAPFNRAVDDLAGCSGMVIDLRGNPGGVAGMLMGIAGAFLGEVRPLGVMRTRQGELRFVSNPRRSGPDGRPREPYSGPVAILIDDQSMSTSEVFAGGMQAIGRGRVFGVTSPGYALPAMMLRLPTGDVLYHAFANLTDPNGRRIEGVGVVPDVSLPLRREDLLAGRDRAMEEAVAWIASQSAGPGSSGVR